MNLLDKLKIEKQSIIDSLKYELETVRNLIATSLERLASEDFADLSELDRHTDMLTFYRRQIGFVNQMIGMLSLYDVPQLEKLVSEMAEKFIKGDLPHISDATPTQQLWAIYEYVERLKIDNTSLKEQIHEVALRHAADYPNIESVEAHEQLYAVDQSCQGISLANATCHQFIVALGERLGMTKEQTYEEFSKLVQEVAKELTR